MIWKPREVRAGAVRGLSIGFATKDAKRTAKGRQINALELLEISIVPVPAHPLATITAMKANTIVNEEIPCMENETNPVEAEAQTIPANDTPAIPAVDQKSFDAMKARLDALEIKAARPGVIGIPALNMGADETKSFVDYVRTGIMDHKALNYGSAASGQVLAPDATAKSVLEKVAEFSPVRGLAQVIGMGGPLLQLPRLVDEIEVADVGETEDRPESEPTFDQIELKPFEMAVTVPVTRILLEDAQIDLNAYLTDHIARRFGQREARHFIRGDGTTQAEGLLTNNEIQEFEASVAVPDDVIGLFYEVKTAYAQRGSWLMNRQTMRQIMGMRNVNGDALWQPSLTNSQPPTIMGRPVFEAPDMDGPGENGNVCIVFGDFHAGYAIGDRVGLSILRDEYTGASNGIIKLHARRRVGGRVIQPEALVKLKIKKTA